MNMVVVLMKLFTVQMKRLLMERTALVVMSLVFFPLGVMADDNEVLADSASSPLSYIVLFIIVLILTFGTKPVSAMQTDEEEDEDFDYFPLTSGSKGKDKATGTASTSEIFPCRFCNKKFGNVRGRNTHEDRYCQEKLTLNATEVITKVGTEVFVDYMMQIEAFASDDDKARLIAKLLVAVAAGNVEQTMPQLWNPDHPFLAALEGGRKLYLSHQAQNEAQKANEEERLERRDALPYSALGQRPLVLPGQLPNKKARTTRASKPTLSLGQVAAEIRAANEMAEADRDWYNIDPVIGSDPVLQSSLGTTLGSAPIQHYTQVAEGEHGALVPYDRSSQSSTRASQSSTSSYQSSTASTDQSFLCSAGPSDSSPPTSESSSASFAVGGGGGGLPTPTSSPPTSESSSASSAVGGGGGGGLQTPTSRGNIAVALALAPGLYETRFVRVQLVGNSKFGHLIIRTYIDHDWVDRMKAGYPLQTRPLGAKDTKICLICGGISYASKSWCTYNGCWAQGVDYGVLDMLTEVSMTHTAARKKVR